MRRICQEGLGGQPQAAHIQQGGREPAIAATGRVRKARQVLEGTREVDLVHALEQQRCKLEVGSVWDHGDQPERNLPRRYPIPRLK